MGVTSTAFRQWFRSALYRRPFWLVGGFIGPINALSDTLGRGLEHEPVRQAARLVSGVQSRGEAVNLEREDFSPSARFDLAITVTVHLLTPLG